MLSVVMLSVIMLNVIMLCVVMLNVVEPTTTLAHYDAEFVGGVKSFIERAPD